MSTLFTVFFCNTFSLYDEERWGFYRVRIIVLRLLRLVIVNASFVCFKPEFRRISRAINKPQDEITLSLANEMSILKESLVLTWVFRFGTLNG